MNEETVTNTRHSPLGSLKIVARGDTLAGLFLPSHRGEPAWAAAARESRDHPVLALAAAQLDEYFAGERKAFDLPLGPDGPGGTPFQRSVWRALLEIPFGATRTYAEIARRIGKPAATRAVGLANARNPISIVIPCHRVVGSDGSLTGYAGGEAAKARLLTHEGALLVT